MQDAKNVYAPPEAALESNEVADRARLYSLPAVAVATFLGSFLGGGAVLALNYRRLNRGATALRTLFLAGIAQAALFGLIFTLPDRAHIPNALFTAPQIVIMYYLGKSLQGAELDAQRAAGRRPASGWAAAGIGLVCGLTMMAGMAAVLYEYH